MNRTRLLFYGIVGVVLAILAASLATEVMGPQSLAQIFIGASIFSVGVVALDFLGIFGEGQDDASAGGDGGDVVGDGGDAEVGDHTAGHLDSHGPPILSVLAYLRMTVYFCLGFGPTGWAALASGRSPLIALALAVPMGVMASLAAQAFFRFQRSNTDSTINRADLVNEGATVTIPLTHTEMGKVRVQVGMSVLEQYALAARPGQSFQKGESVRITKVTAECVYVD